MNYYSNLDIFGDKVLSVIGGSGYVGQTLCRQALSLGYRVNAVSRNGKPGNQIWMDQINWIKADALNPEEYKKYLEESDSVIHLIGTLIDQSSNNSKDGSYEQINRDSAIRLGDTLNSFQSGKKLVFLSAARVVPFFKRYLSTKEEAEQYLLNLEHIHTTILKPGVIYSPRERPWTVPLSSFINCYTQNLGILKKILNENHSLIQELEIEQPIPLDDVAIGCIAATLEQFNQQILYNKDISRIKTEFENLAYHS